MRFIGYYLAEGDVSYRESKSYSINFTFHIKEKYYTEDIKNIVKNNFGDFNFYEREIPDKNTRRLSFCSKQLCNFILNHFGTGSHKKIIPSWVWELPKEGFINLLRGYIGDARIRSQNEICYTSVNKNLIESICYIGKLNGIESRISPRFNKEHLSPQKTIIIDSYCYDLIYNSINADKILGNSCNRKRFKNLNSNCLDINVLKKIEPKNYKRYYCSKKKAFGKDKIKTDNDKLNRLLNSALHIVRIKSIEKIKDCIDVYDLHVPETQRFVGGNYPILLHNSELFGSSPPPQNEQTRFQPRSPYAVAKAAGYYATINYREAYNLFACNTICFNHESPRRAETFVTRKITKAATRIKLGLQDFLWLGNLESKRDWGHAKDYAKAMYVIMTSDYPDDYVVSTGQMHSVKEFVQIVFEKLDLDWTKYVKFDPKYLRPSEVDALLGDSSKLRNALGWSPEYNFDMLVDEMLERDMRDAEREKHIIIHGLGANLKL